MFFNVRGISTKIYEVMEFMKQNGVVVGLFTETRCAGEDFSTADWHWIQGAEYIPSLGSSCPKLGLGCLVCKRTFPSRPAVLESSHHGLWLRLPGKGADLVSGVVYVPCYPNAEREHIFKSLGKSFSSFRDMGIVVLGGDFNSRTGANGDRVVNTPGRELLQFFSSQSVALVNMLPGVTKMRDTRYVFQRERYLNKNL